MSAPTSRLKTPEWSDSTRTIMRSESTWSTMPSRLQSTTAPESRAVTRSMPVPTKGASPRISGTAWRSEEHTSELQSRSDLVCRLLLEKKKKKKNRSICAYMKDDIRV